VTSKSSRKTAITIEEATLEGRTVSGKEGQPNNATRLLLRRHMDEVIYFVATFSFGK
jgi:hypothetical protein